MIWGDAHFQVGAVTQRQWRIGRTQFGNWRLVRLTRTLDFAINVPEQVALGESGADAVAPELPVATAL